MISSIKDIKTLSNRRKKLLGVIYELDSTIELCALGEAFQIIFKNNIQTEQNEVIDLLIDLISNEIIINLGKLFSRSKSNNTCSLYSINISDNIQQNKELESISQEYKKYKKIRDKRVGHLDLEVLIKMNKVTIDLDEVEALLKKIRIYISNYYSYDDLLGFISVDEKRKFFIKRLNELTAKIK